VRSSADQRPSPWGLGQSTASSAVAGVSTAVSTVVSTRGSEPFRYGVSSRSRRYCSSAAITRPETGIRRDRSARPAARAQRPRPDAGSPVHSVDGTMKDDRFVACRLVGGDCSTAAVGHKPSAKLAALRKT
jgi:hypothetical protein